MDRIAAAISIALLGMAVIATAVLLGNTLEEVQDVNTRMECTLNLHDEVVRDFQRRTAELFDAAFHDGDVESLLEEMVRASRGNLEGEIERRC